MGNSIEDRAKEFAAKGDHGIDESWFTWKLVQFAQAENARKDALIEALVGAAKSALGDLDMEGLDEGDTYIELKAAIAAAGSHGEGSNVITE